MSTNPLSRLRWLWAPSAVAALAVLSLMWLRSPAGAEQPPAPRELVTQGCQGEGCRTAGVWIAAADFHLYQDRGSADAAADPGILVRARTPVEVRESVIVTDRPGEAVLLRDLDLPADGRGQGRPPVLKAGTRIATLAYLGEGTVLATGPDGTRFEIDRTGYRELRPFRATDWVKLTTLDGRTGWTDRKDRLDCTSHSDDCPLATGQKPPEHLFFPWPDGEHRGYGTWYAMADVPVYDSYADGKRMRFLLREDAVVEAQEGVTLVRTAGASVITRDGEWRKGTRFWIVRDYGDGHVDGLTPDRFLLGVPQDAFQDLAPYRAASWYRIRLPDGREGWTDRNDLFACSSDHDAPSCDDYKARSRAKSAARP